MCVYKNPDKKDLKKLNKRRMKLPLVPSVAVSFLDIVDKLEEVNK